MGWELDILSEGVLQLKKNTEIENFTKEEFSNVTGNVTAWRSWLSKVYGSGPESYLLKM